MTGILAIDTSTEACSVAVWIDGQCREEYERIPRQHSQKLFPMLQSMLPRGGLRDSGIDAIAYTCGPGSFTGLRIGVSAVQGLAFASDLPTIGVSTLATQAQTALRTGVASADALVLSTLDAQIQEVYFALCRFEDGLAVLQQAAQVCTPDKMPAFAGQSRMQAIGSGLRHVDSMPAQLRARLELQEPSLLPSARDLVPLALAAIARGEAQAARAAQPVYVRDEITWKKLAEQGRPG